MPLVRLSAIALLALALSGCDAIIINVGPYLGIGVHEEITTEKLIDRHEPLFDQAWDLRSYAQSPALDELQKSLTQKVAEFDELIELSVCRTVRGVDECVFSYFRFGRHPRGSACSSAYRPSQRQLMRCDWKGNASEPTDVLRYERSGELNGSHWELHASYDYKKVRLILSN